ncbi:hypothetical protein [Actinoplanes sp. URMC 104]|uniref:hypothetical protein n=1 Tax=Actinoplanes sp. URMC 104 TaxID=3423409 RepID=UPI003F1D9886
MTRWLGFYCRSRRLPAALLLSVAASALSWAGWSVFSDSREVNGNLAMLTVLLALAPLIPTLSGDDDSLESTAALPWPPRRAVHLLVLVVVVSVPLVASRATGASFGPAQVLIRDAAGLAGVIGLGAALAGARMAWQVPICWTVAQLMFTRSEPGWAQAVFWLTQPAGSRVAAATAAGLFGAGVLTYAWRAGPRRAPAEAILGQ